MRVVRRARKRDDGMRVETGEAGIRELKGRKMRDKVFARFGSFEVTEKEYREEIQNAVV